MTNVAVNCYDISVCNNFTQWVGFHPRGCVHGVPEKTISGHRQTYNACIIRWQFDKLYASIIFLSVIYRLWNYYLNDFSQWKSETTARENQSRFPWQEENLCLSVSQAHITHTKNLNPLNSRCHMILSMIAITADSLFCWVLIFLRGLL